MKMTKAMWGILFSCSLLSLFPGDASRTELALRIRKRYLEKELAEHLLSSNMGEQLTHLISARRPQPPPGPYYGSNPLPPPRITVAIPYAPDVNIIMRPSGSLDIHLGMLFGVYFGRKEVEIQVRKNFSAVISRSSDGFSIKECRSCLGLLDIKTLYKPSDTLIDDASTMVQMTLRKDLVPVLDANACALLEAAFSSPAGSLLSPELFDLSHPGMQYSVKSTQMKGDDLVLELSVSAGQGEAGSGEEGSASLLESLPSMNKKAVADISMTEKQMDGNFAQLLDKLFDYVVVDTNHSLGFCVLENILTLLPEEISYDELENMVVNVTAQGPPRFIVESYGAYAEHPLNIVVTHIKEQEHSTWTLTDVYRVPAEVSTEDYKLKISLSLSGAFLNMDVENHQASEMVTVLQQVLEAEMPPPPLEKIQMKFPLPAAPGVGDTMKIEVKTYEHILSIAVIPDFNALRSPAEK